jgi:hypothetical protein
MAELPLTWTASELLADFDVAEPLIAGGVRCHGGFAADGEYVSPRTKNRVPAIRGWQQSHRRQFGTEILDAPIDLWPEVFPSVAQTKYLLREGVAAPTISSLTRIGTVEGFGSMIRAVQVDRLQSRFDESIAGTAIEHLQRGLFEAHARDEAGWEDEGGHKQMWFAARDIAFEMPTTEDETERMLQRLGITMGGGGATAPPRLLPDDIAVELELLIERMVRLLLIEVSAYHTFAWAEELLADGELVAGDGEAAELVSYIRTDESPHVEYLRTTLSEMRDRAFVGASGRVYAGAELIGRLWDRALSESLGPRRKLMKQTSAAEVERAVRARPDAGDLLDEFHTLES